MQEQKASVANSLDMARCFSDAADIYKKNLLMLVLGALLFQLISLFTLFVLAGVLYGGYCVMLLNAMRKQDKKVELKDLFSLFNRFWPLTGLFAVQSLLTFLGFFLLIIPGVILATMWLFTFFIMVDKDKAIMDCLKESWNMVKANGFWMNLTLFIVYILITALPPYIPYIGWLLGPFVLPFGVLLIASGYTQQSVKAPKLAA